MKTRTTTMLLVLVLLGGAYLAQGQWYDGAYIDNRASTPGQAAAYGLGEVIRAQGQYNVDTSQAAINMTEAQNKDIQNREAWTKTYFEMRKMNKAYRDAEAGPRPSMEALVRYAEAGRPQALSPAELSTSGKIAWPGALQAPRYGSQRQQVEQAFAERAVKGVMPGDEYQKLYTLTNNMMADLKGHITSLAPDAYITAKKFLQSLIYEARQPAS